jgi:hypothetical protein
MEILTFEERNRNNYQKVSDVPQEVIDKYKNLLPNELISIWKTMGFGIYENGYLQIINPMEYDFVFQYIDKSLEPTIVWGMTALGDLLLWEGNNNWTVAADEGNRSVFLNVRNTKRRMMGHNIDVFLDILVNDIDDLTKYYKAQPYLEIKDKLPPLEYGQCYGYMPAIALGGSASIKNLKIVGAKTYIDIIGQAVGKIVDLS